MTTLPELSTDQLKAIQIKIEQFFYKVGVNIGHLSQLRSPRYKKFRDDVKAAMEKQIINVTTDRKIAAIAKTLKKAGSPLDPYWIPFLAIISEEEVSDFIKWSANSGGKVIVGKLGNTGTFNLVNSTILGGFDKRAGFVIDSVDGTTKAWVISQIGAGLENGMTANEIAKSMRDSMGDMIEMRSNLIAEAESANAISTIEMQIYKKSGITKQHWVTSHDERVEEQCLQNEAAGSIEIGKDFPSGVVAPPAHLRCRCFLQPDGEIKTDQIWLGD